MQPNRLERTLTSAVPVADEPESDAPHDATRLIGRRWPHSHHHHPY